MVLATSRVAAAGAQEVARSDSATSGPHVHARAHATNSAHSDARWRIGPFVGISLSSSGTSFLGSTPGRTSVFLGFSAATPVLRAGPLHLSYMAQALPFVMIQGRAAPTNYVPGYGGGVTLSRLLHEPDRAYAVGLSPFGLELATPTTRRLALYGAAAAGGLIFTRPFPVPEGTRVNFTLEFGGGALLRVGRDRWVQLGYKFHHISNAYTARLNPALAANVFYAGYQWSVHLPR